MKEIRPEEPTAEESEEQERIEDYRQGAIESDFLGDLLTELATAQARHAPLQSLHEAYAVILEEVDELWEEVRKKKEDRVRLDVRKELLQIAAMAWRAAADLDMADVY